MKDIKKRIKELEDEIKEHQIESTKHKQAINQIQVMIISKGGAIVELKKLIKGKDDKKSNNK